MKLDEGHSSCREECGGIASSMTNLLQLPERQPTFTIALKVFNEENCNSGLVWHIYLLTTNDEHLFTGFLLQKGMGAAKKRKWRSHTKSIYGLNPILLIKRIRKYKLNLITKSQIEYGQARYQLIVVRPMIFIPSAVLVTNLLLPPVFAIKELIKSKTPFLLSKFLVLINMEPLDHLRQKPVGCRYKIIAYLHQH